MTIFPSIWIAIAIAIAVDISLSVRFVKLLKQIKEHPLKLTKQVSNAALNPCFRQEIIAQTITSQKAKNIQMNENINMTNQHRDGAEKK